MSLGKERGCLQEAVYPPRDPRSRQHCEHRQLNGKIALSLAAESSPFQGWRWGWGSAGLSLPICLPHPSPLWFSAENVLETWTELPPITQPASLQIPGINAINGGEADSLQPPVWPAQHRLPTAAKSLCPSYFPTLNRDSTMCHSHMCLSKGRRPSVHQRGLHLEHLIP